MFVNKGLFIVLIDVQMRVLTLPQFYYLILNSMMRNASITWAFVCLFKERLWLKRFC